jgi:hypothetical protein
MYTGPIIIGSAHAMPAITESHAVLHAGQLNSFVRNTIMDHLEQDIFSDKKSGKNLLGYSAM